MARAGLRRRTVATLVAAGLVVPGAAIADPGELRSAEEELEVAGRDLARVNAELDAAAARVADLDRDLAEASGDLAALRDELAVATEVADAASARERDAAARLAAATATIEAEADTWARHADRLQDRAAQAYMYGSPSLLIVRGLVEADDLHQVAVALHTVENLVAEDRALVTASQKAARVAATAHATVDAAREEALAAAATAAAERRRVAALTARQEALVTRIAAERDERAAILAAIEADHAQTALLVRRLEATVAALQLEAARVLLEANADVPIDGPMPAWGARLPERGRRWAPAIDAVAQHVGVDGRLLAALVWTESNFTPTAVSHAGAMGLAQLMPGTARGLKVDPTDPIQNLTGGARYLRIQLERFGRVDLALAAYNAGPGRVEAAGRTIPEIVETQLYVLRVLERFERIVGPDGT